MHLNLALIVRAYAFLLNRHFNIHVSHKSRSAPEAGLLYFHHLQERITIIIFRPLFMHKPALYIAILLAFSSCKLTADTVAGTYRQNNKISSRLILRKDKTFEFTGSKNALVDPATSTNSDNLNFLASGTWELRSNQIMLNSSASDSLSGEHSFTDSIERFTSITSFNFWNRYGDPVSIRSIRLSPTKTKPHFGNSIYLFAQDFPRTDTLIFQFEGYPDFSYPGSIPYAIGNNMHKIVLQEPYLSSAFNNTVLIPKKNKLLTPQNNIVFTKNN